MNLTLDIKGIEFDEQLANAATTQRAKKQERKSKNKKLRLRFLRQMQSAFNRGKVEMLDNF